MPQSGIPFVERNNIFSKTLRFRQRLAGQSEVEGVSSLETVKVTLGALAIGATTVYTCPAGKRAKVMRGLLALTNPTGAGIVCDVYHVPAGGTVQTTNKLGTITVNAVSGPNTFWSGVLWHVLQPGDALVINTGAAGMNLWASILEERLAAVAFHGGFVGNLPAADTTVYTSPALRSSAIKTVNVFNPTAGPLDITVNVRESGVAVAQGNQYAKFVALGAGAGFVFDAFALPMIAQNGVVSAKGSLVGANVWIDAVLV